MISYLCVKHKDSHFACTCEKCFKEFMESLDRIWILPIIKNYEKSPPKANPSP